MNSPTPVQTDPTLSPGVHVLAVLLGLAGSWLTARGLPAAASTALVAWATGGAGVVITTFTHLVDAIITKYRS